MVDFTGTSVTELPEVVDVSTGAEVSIGRTVAEALE